ncbi:hypothetical protein RAG25_06480 [Klebsiella pneumoniae]
MGPFGGRWRLLLPRWTPGMTVRVDWETGVGDEGSHGW